MIARERIAGENPLLEAALHYCDLGWSVFPLRPRDKKPLIDSWEACQKTRASKDRIRAFWEKNPSANIAVVTGEISGIVVLDVDGPEGENSIKGKHLPPTPVVVTGKGKHYYFKHPGFPIRNFAGKLPGVDLRGDGGYVVAPPSVHPSGRQYAWADGLSPDDVELAPLPEWVIELAEKQEKGRVAPEEWATDIPEGRRNEELTRRAGSLIAKGIPPGEVLTMLLAWNWEHCKPPLPEKEVKAIVESIAKRESQKAAKEKEQPQRLTKEDLEAAYKRAFETVGAARDNPGAPFEAVAAFAVLRKYDPAKYEALRAELRKARVRVAELDKQVDEFLRQAEAGGPARHPVPVYEVVDGLTCRVQFNERGEAEYIPLCNFEAKIISEERRDDGLETSISFIIEGRLPNGQPLPTVRVDASSFPNIVSWVTKEWGNRAVVYAGLNTKDHLRTAIQLLSGEVPRRTVYTHTGWRKVEGKWVYLTSGGGIGPEGLVPGVEVELEKSLRDYYLPEPPEGERLREAVRCSLKLLDLGPERITAPLLGAVYLAPLGEATELDLSLFLVGRTGGFKTATAAVMLGHWGPSWNDRNLPGGWVSTANSLEKAAFLAKDAVFVVDDFVPRGNTSEVQRIHREADRLLRAQANRQGRLRMNSDRTLAPEYFPRGIVISSGEDLPVGHSLNARMCIIEVTAPERGTPGDIDVARLTEAQEWAAKGLLAEAMAGYVKWLAPQMDELKKTLGEVRRQLRQKAYREGQHRRTPDMVAALCLGWLWWLDYAESIGAVTNEERREIANRAWRGLGEMAEAQAEHLASEDVANRFLSLLSAAIASGRAHIANAKDGREPSDPDAWGWREDSIGPVSSEWRPQGELIGWLDGVNVYLEPETAYAVAQKLARDQNLSLPVQPKTLWKRLREKGLLTATEGTKNTVKRQITQEGRKRRVLCLHFMSLLSSEKGDSGDSGDFPSSEARKKSPFPEFHEENGGPEKGTEFLPGGAEVRSPISSPPFLAPVEEWGTKTGRKLPDREPKSPMSPKSPILGEDTQENLEKPRHDQTPAREEESPPSSASVRFNTLDYRRDPKTGEWVYDPGWYEREIPRRGRDPL